jgi:hypothetical protein
MYEYMYSDEAIPGGLVTRDIGALSPVSVIRADLISLLGAIKRLTIG